ncbi:relaxase/mobilization nuclease domain-containing protein [Saccharothrix australiensis]|uniref:MobA/VirD2-like nuclease domain-containing protein n=1 Tax=Saccharothrix australiensis TaxID=2072 RepID=A0A495VXT1_9PSEU|nr:hypothetical protein [Saccharothrix australiensis]RKT53547.1 hypothetical protein C8E97_2115 [Saccharothrix australiensis]
MIAKAPAKGKYGKDTYGLLRYLFGPGKSNEHTDPHLVATWDPEWLEGGAFAERHRGWLARLAREIDAPMTGHEVDLEGGHVYHLVLSIPSQDGRLGDTRWRELVEEAIDRMGFGPTDDGRAGCRWAAVHHGPSKEGNDHVHVAINLVRGDGTVAGTYRDWPRWRQWCLEVEQRLDLTRTSPSDKTAAVRPTRAEVEKAARTRRPGASRDALRKAVRAAAAEAASAREFIALLEQVPLVSVQARWSSTGELTGYRVGMFADRSTTSADGRVWFGGGSLAYDLSAPMLVARWAGVNDSTTVSLATRRDRDVVLLRATQVVDAAQQYLAASVAAGDVSIASDDGDIIHATEDVLIAVARSLSGPSSNAIAEAADAYEKAAVAPRRLGPPYWSGMAADLRAVARDVIRIGLQSKRVTTGALVTALLSALMSLVLEVATWWQLSHRPAQAAAAHSAAVMIEDHGATLPTWQVSNRSSLGASRPTAALKRPDLLPRAPKPTLRDPGLSPRRTR